MTHLERLMAALSDPARYGGAPVEVHQTHISVVIVAGEVAYKFKKPVDFGFVDYSSLARRRHFCEEEVRLNRRLAPDVYLAVVPIVDGPDGPCFEGEGEPIEWSVKMVRLDESETLGSRLARGRVPAGLMPRLGKLIASFHAGAARGEAIADYGRFEVVAKNVRDNFTQSEAHVGVTVEASVHARLRVLSEAWLAEFEATIAARAKAQVPLDAHGDLRLEHVYVEDDGGIAVVDCIEFNPAFRYSDPVLDVAFLTMDLGVRGYDAEAKAFVDAYFGACGDAEGQALLRGYEAYRSVVRAKVHGFKACEPEVDAADRRAAAEKGKMHWLYALRLLEAPEKASVLVLLGGLPGTGKSTLSRALLEAGLVDTVIDSDIVRKELAGLGDGDGSASFGEGIYTASWSGRTYAECGVRANDALSRGARVLVDATFGDAGRREALAGVARQLGLRVVLVECTLPEEVARERIRARCGDISDAGLEVYEAMARTWAHFGAPIDMSGGIEDAVDEVRCLLVPR